MLRRDMLIMVNGGNQRGTMLPLFVVAMVALLGLAGLAIDTGMLLLSVRDAQRAADAASLAAANSLRNLTTPAGWQDSKKAALAAFSINRVYGLDAAARQSLASGSGAYSFRYTDLNYSATPEDLPMYDRNTGQAGNMRISVVRGLFCYEPDPLLAGKFIRRWYSLEVGFPRRYCYANSVRVEMEIRNLQTTFLKVIGMALIPKIKVVSTSYLKEPNTCGLPLCSTIGMVDGTSDEFAQHFVPTVACP